MKQPTTLKTMSQGTLLFGIVVITAATYGIPFLGPIASLLLIGFTHAARFSLWPSATERESTICSVLAWVGLWLPTMVDLFSPLLDEAGINVSTTWLLIPLCEPTHASTQVLPAVAATAVCLVGLAAARAVKRPWPWMIAAWLAPWAHIATSSLTPNSFAC